MRHPYRFAILIIFALAACALAQPRSTNRRVTVAFSGGLNLRDNAAVLGRMDGAGVQPYVTGDSYNFDYYPDGTARKRPGLTEDTCSLGNGSTSLLYYDPRPRRRGEGGALTFAIVDSNWYQRFNEDWPNAWGGAKNTGDWIKVTDDQGRPYGVVSRGIGFLQAVYYNGRPIVVGDISDIVHTTTPPRRLGYNFDIVNRLMLPVPTVGTATATTGGSLTADKQYWYAISFAGPFTQANGSYEEGYLGDTIRVTPTGTNLTASLASLPIVPNRIPLSEADYWSVASARFVYRGNADSALAYIATITDPTATTFTDNGSYIRDLTKLAPDNAPVHTIARMAADYNDFLVTTGPASKQISRYFVTAQIDASPSSDTLLSVKPFSTDLSSVVKQVVSGGWTYSDYGFSEKTLVTSASAKFITNGVSPGDYFIYTAGAITGQNVPSIVHHVLSETELVTDDINTNAKTSKGSTVGNNLFRMGNEIIGLAYATTTQWRIQRGLLNSDEAGASALTPLYRYNSDLYSSALYVSEAYNPLRYAEPIGNYANPIYVSPGTGPITGLLTFADRLWIFKDRAKFSLYGNSPENFVVRRDWAEQGNISPRALAQYSGGVLCLDKKGVYWGADGPPTRLSAILGDALLDSAAAGYYSEAAGYVHGDRYYLSVIKSTGPFVARTWVYDFNLNMWTKYRGWYPRTWAAWPDEDNETPQLYWGDWRKGNIYKVNPTRTADVSIAGADSNITCQIVTPRYNYGDRDAWFEEFVLRIDTADSVRVSFSIGQFDSVWTHPTVGTISTTQAADFFTSGVPGHYRFPIRATGNSCQITIWTRGTGRCTIYPSTLVVSDPKDQ